MSNSNPKKRREKKEKEFCVWVRKKGKQTNAWQKKGEKEGDNGRKLRTESKAEINEGKMDGQTGI